MRLRPAYFAVTRPFRVLVAVGRSDSNTWIGASRAIETRYEARNAQPGSIVHSLPGGTFLQDPDGALHQARLRKPKHILEKDYGGYSDDRRLDDMLRAGLLDPAPRPATADYAAARARADKRFTPNQGGVVTVEQSSELTGLREDMADFVEALRDDGASVRYLDIGEDDRVEIRIAYPGAAEAGIMRSPITLETWANGELPPGSALAEPFAGLSGEGRLRREAFVERMEAARARQPVAGR